jgi:hypothetical protein
MHRDVILACLPWVALLVVSILGLRGLVSLSGARMQLGRLRRLHNDQGGAVQSLSFVLTLPIFVVLMMFIVQVSQVAIGTVVVHYAAYAAARSAMVWIPAEVGMIFDAANDTGGMFPIGNGQYQLAEGSIKHNQIQRAGAMACASIAPSRDISDVAPANGSPANAVYRLYQYMSPDSASNGRIAARLQNKLNYSLSHTWVKVTVVHNYKDPPLFRYEIPRYLEEYQPNEIGWQDPITVTLTHDMALLPGPGRILARQADKPTGPDQVSPRIGRSGSVYTYRLEGIATLNNEGEKSMVPYVQQPGYASN